MLCWPKKMNTTKAGHSKKSILEVGKVLLKLISAIHRNNLTFYKIYTFTIRFFNRKHIDFI